MTESEVKVRNCTGIQEDLINQEQISGCGCIVVVEWAGGGGWPLLSRLFAFRGSAKRGPTVVRQCVRSISDQNFINR